MPAFRFPSAVIAASSKALGIDILPWDCTRDWKVRSGCAIFCAKLKLPAVVLGTDDLMVVVFSSEDDEAGEEDAANGDDV